MSMNRLNDSAAVNQQYATAERLNKRISIHEKYSTNKTGFGNWIFSNYRIDSGANILELGCGTGDMWKNHGELITSLSKLILSDLSEGMVEAARSSVGCHGNVEYKIIDIQNIPYADESFDSVIANMMLYHVPDIDKGLREVRRVLKQNGTFYCATYGEHGIVEYLGAILSDYGVEDKVNKNFTLQNGRGILEKHFPSVKRLDYPDSLAVTDPDDMVDYIYSLASMSSLSGVPRENIRKILLHHMENGVLTVPKEYGMFIAAKQRDY